MFNVQGLTKMLAGKDLAYIQSYANAHKNDPLVVATALHVANMKKEMQTAQQGQAGQQPMPSVVDQDIAAIKSEAPAPDMSAAQLPEDVGIAQLPADNMQGMAAGGIVAFEEGGHVPRYAGNTNGSLVEAGYWDPNTGEYIINENRDTRSIGDKFLDAINWKKGLEIDPRGGIGKPAPTAPAKTTTPFTVTSTEPTGNVMGSRRTPLELAKEAADKADTGRKGGQDDAGIAKLLPAAPGAGKVTPTAAPAQSGLGSIAEFAKEANAYTGADPTARQLERIEKQEAKADSDKSEALNMAIIKAGLGMMSGTSQHAFENIGKGAMGGLEDYAAAMKDLKKAALERDKMRDAAEQAAYAYKRDDVKGYRQAQEKLADREADWKRAVLQADTTMRAAQTSAGAHLAAAKLPGAQERLLSSLGEGDVAKGLKIYQEAQADKTGASYAALYAKHLGDAQEKGYQPESPEMFAQKMQMMLQAMQGGGFQQQPANTAVRKLPGTP